MLIETPIKMNDIVTLKLIGGDEVVGKLTDERTDSYLELKNPLVVIVNQQGFGLMAYIFTAEAGIPVKIDRSAVISFSKTMDSVAKEYIKQTTGLIT